MATRTARSNASARPPHAARAWEVTGFRTSTGDEAQLTLDAASAADAKQCARDRDIEPRIVRELDAAAAQALASRAA